MTPNLNFLRRKRSEEDELDREIVEAAKIRGRKRAKDEKLKKKIERAEQRAYDKEMKGKLATVGGALKTMYNGAMQISEVCAGVTGSVIEEEKRRKKRDRAEGYSEELRY